jgi:hypothetical protein
MGPEIIIIAVSSWVATLMGLILVVGVALPRTRRFSASILTIALIAAAAGYFTTKPHWERYTAEFYFALTSTVLTLGVLVWVFGRFVVRQTKSQSTLA